MLNAYAFASKGSGVRGHVTQEDRESPDEIKQFLACFQCTARNYQRNLKWISVNIECLRISNSDAIQLKLYNDIEYNYIMI